MEMIENKLKIEDRIFTIRGQQLMLDRDLAHLYGVDVSQMNRQVKRNIERFPRDFMFQLSKEEYDYLKCQNGISNSRGGDRALPYAFTEHGISIQSTPTALPNNFVWTSSGIINSIRRLISMNSERRTTGFLSLIMRFT